MVMLQGTRPDCLPPENRCARSGQKRSGRSRQPISRSHRLEENCCLLTASTGRYDREIQQTHPQVSPVVFAASPATPQLDPEPGANSAPATCQARCRRRGEMSRRLDAVVGEQAKRRERRAGEPAPPLRQKTCSACSVPAPADIRPSIVSAVPTTHRVRWTRSCLSATN
jgi:hypothetical protein